MPGSPQTGYLKKLQIQQLRNRSRNIPDRYCNLSFLPSVIITDTLEESQADSIISTRQ